MKHFLFTVLSVLASLPAVAQMGITSVEQLRTTAVDTARYKLTYSLDYTWHPDIQNRFDDVRTVQIGRHTVKDFSDIIFHYDSLCTADARRGADTFSNPPGMPWPCEIILSDRGRQSDIKYRLPVQNSILHYTDSVPAIDWSFASDTTLTVLGYECRLARCEFAGRHYSAWFSLELPLPYGPYKFGGLPGLILRIQDDEGQFVWTATGIERSSEPICVYEYESEKNCSASEASKTIARCFRTPIAFQLAAYGGAKGRVMIVGKDGRTRDATEIEDTPIPYKPIEIK